MSDWLFDQQAQAADQADRLAAQNAATAANVAVNTTSIATIEGLADYVRLAGAAYETIPRWSSFTGGAVTIPSGQLGLTAIGLPAGLTVNTITCWSASVGATTPTHQWYGLYDLNFVQLATTADDLTTAWAANSAKTLPVATTADGPAATFTTTYEGLHYLGFMVTALTPPNQQCISNCFRYQQLPVVYGLADSGLTDPPTFPFTTAALAADHFIIYAYVA